ncbi:MAG: hypothetical protein ABI378_04015 [Chitinophagaceae bacterium]
MDKKYKIAKAIDIIGQVGCFLIPLFWAMMTQATYQGIYLGMMLSLLTLGKWQFFSFLIHLPFIRQPWISKFRKVYGVILFFVFIFIILSFIFFFLIISLARYVLYMGIGMVLFYFIISLIEWADMEAMTTPTILETTDREGIF